VLRWGDDWNDRPYEYNAGQPYENRPGQLMVCAYTGPLVPPCDGLVNSRWSVQDINARKVPWLTRPLWMTAGCPDIQILAGQTFREFRELIWRSDGQVMCPVVRADNNRQIGGP